MVVPVAHDKHIPQRQRLEEGEDGVQIRVARSDKHQSQGLGTWMMEVERLAVFPMRIMFGRICTPIRPART